MHCDKVAGSLAAGIFEVFNHDFHSGGDVETLAWKMLETFLKSLVTTSQF